MVLLLPYEICHTEQILVPYLAKLRIRSRSWKNLSVTKRQVDSDSFFIFYLTDDELTAADFARVFIVSLDNIVILFLQKHAIGHKQDLSCRNNQLNRTT